MRANGVFILCLKTRTACFIYKTRTSSPTYFKAWAIITSKETRICRLRWTTFSGNSTKRCLPFITLSTYSTKSKLIKNKNREWKSSFFVYDKSMNRPDLLFLSGTSNVSTLIWTNWNRSEMNPPSWQRTLSEVLLLSELSCRESLQPRPSSEMSQWK